MEEEKKRGFAFKARWFYVIPMLLLLVVLLGVTMARTSTTSYCLSCHEMQTHKNELEKSSHALDKDKQPIECAQCHLPAGVGPRYAAVKAYSGISDLWAHYFGDPSGLDRRHLQVEARRFLMDDNCLACHQDLSQTGTDTKVRPYGDTC
jgi:cytochrome c-type protein NapC